LSGESLGLVRYFAVREGKDEIVTPQPVKDGGILFDSAADNWRSSSIN